jgi:putative DNA primase/helicase
MPAKKTKSEILKSLVSQVKPIDFKRELYPNLPDEEREQKKVKLSEMIVLVIDDVLKQAQAHNWALCKNDGFCYLYNGAYWETLNDEDLKQFLSACAAKMGVKKSQSKYHKFANELYQQFIFSAYLQPPEFDKNTVLINLRNGTFQITPDSQKLNNFDTSDFLTYQLPFEFDEKAECPIFEKYINRVLPDESSRKVLAEYCGYLFIRHGCSLKLEKCLILYGNGANGKSVFFEVLTSLLGNENVSTYTVEDLTDKTGYHRAEISNKLLNYASEISKSMNTDLFKKLASGETFTARSPYGRPFEVRNYAKMIFNANEMPKDTEQTKAYFRRFLIVPFSETIPDEEQDKELHTKIINNELAGVFNWVLAGLKRLLQQRNFTDCNAANEALKKYQTESDSVQMFLDEKNYQKSNRTNVSLKDLYSEYRAFCYEDGYKNCSNRTFSKRLRNKNYIIDRVGAGRVVWVEEKQIEKYVNDEKEPLPF